MSERRFCYKCMEKYDKKMHICPHCGYDDTTPHNPMYITPGTILRDRYLIGILLRFNGESATYIGHDMSTDCKVIIREYMPVNLCSRVKNKATISVNYDNLAKYKAFMAEYTELNKSIARLRNNSNIMPVLDMFAENNTTYTIFENIEGMKLMDYIKENAGELSWDQVSRIFPQLFTTVGILHNSGLIHRAICPENIYINQKGELKITGFCVSAVRTVNAGLEHELFKGYTAPEQYSGNTDSRQGSWTDVYGICALLYRCLTGCMPVDAKERLKSDDLLPPDQINSSIPPHVSRVIMDGMNLSGRDRIQTITELVTRLFEQPVPPVKAVPSQDTATAQQNANAVQQRQYQQQVIYNQQQQQQYQQMMYQRQNQQYRRQNEQDDYRLEKVNTVDRLKVPVIIGILLFLILFIISAVIASMVIPAKNSQKNKNNRTSSVTDNNVVDDEEEPMTELPLDTEMPDLIGKFYELTEQKYRDFFTFEAIYDYNDEYESDMIYDQDISEGTQVSRGQIVKVKVSKGKNNTLIPEFAGFSVTQYEIKLKEAGISNYNLIASNNAWGTPNTIVTIQVDGKDVKPGEKFSNKLGKKLDVYYIPEYIPPTYNYAEVPTEAYTDIIEPTDTIPSGTEAVGGETITTPDTPNSGNDTPSGGDTPQENPGGTPNEQTPVTPQNPSPVPDTPSGGGETGGGAE